MASIPESVMKSERKEYSEETLKVEIFELPTDRQLYQNERQLPKDLQGSVFFVTPLRRDGDHASILNGDGMIYRLSFKDGVPTLRSRIAKTPCYYADALTQPRDKDPKQDKYQKYRFINVGIPRLSLSLGTRNQPNTAFLKTKNHLFVTSDAGQPYQFDPDSLELIAPVGKAADWKSMLPFMNKQVFQPYASSAHPVSGAPGERDENSVFTVNYSRGWFVCSGINWIEKGLDKLMGFLPGSKSWSSSFTTLIRYNSNNKNLDRWQLVHSDEAQTPVFIEQSVHQLAITEKYIILADVAFQLEISQIILALITQRSPKPLVGFIENLPLLKQAISWLSRRIKPLPFTNLYIVSRNDLDKNDKTSKLPVRKITFPYAISHFAADYKNPDNQITFHFGCNNGWDYTEWIKKSDQCSCDGKEIDQGLKGMIVGSVDLGSLVRFVVDGEAGTVLNSNLISDSQHTWALSVFTNDEDENLKYGNVKSMYWMNWGFTPELIPKRIYEDYQKETSISDEYHYRGISPEHLPRERKPVTLLKLDTKEMKIADHYEFNLKQFACSPQFIPSSEQGSDQVTAGYIVCMVFADDPDSSDKPQDEFWIFRADALCKGPIYKLQPFSGGSFNLGLSLHTAWLSAEEMDRMKWAEDMRKNEREAVWKDLQEQLEKNQKGRSEIQELFCKIHKSFVDQTLEENLVREG